MIGFLHQCPGFALLMDTEQLNLIVDRIVNAIDKLTDAVMTAETSATEAMRRCTHAIEYIQLECDK